MGLAGGNCFIEAETAARRAAGFQEAVEVDVDVELIVSRPLRSSPVVVWLLLAVSDSLML